MGEFSSAGDGTLQIRWVRCGTRVAWVTARSGAFDEAYELGLTVSVGIWLGHERHGFDYDDADAVRRQLPCVAHAVAVGDRRKFVSVLLTLKTEADPDTGAPTGALTRAAADWGREAAAVSMSHYHFPKVEVDC